MATPAKKSMGPKRKGKKQYPMVAFEFDGFEGEFTLPKLDVLPLGVAAALSDGELSRLISFLHEYAEDSADAFEDIASDEMESFMDAWSKASGVETPGK